MVNSMTGFASAKGSDSHAQWDWDIRSVNARGLDVRLRLPDGFEALETLCRKAITAAVARGNVSLALRLQRAPASAPLAVNGDQLDSVVLALKAAEDAADKLGLVLTASSAATLLGVKGVLEPGAATARDNTAQVAAMAGEINALIDEFTASRAVEGCALDKILRRQVDEIADLVSQARDLARARQPEVAQKLRDNLKTLLDNTDGLDEARLAQELAVLAVKSDVTEELDRLNAHVSAADALLVQDGAVGRKLDFLMQEFNREANTLCSKSGSTALTNVGLSLKTVIDQMREQVQNVE